jgi:hypothetical protein
MFEFILFLLSIVGTASAIWLGGGRSHWYPNEAMPKPRFFAALGLVLVAQSGQYWMSHKRAKDDAGVQAKLIDGNTKLLESNARLEERNGTLQLSVASATALIVKLAAESNSHNVKQEAQAFKQEQETLEAQNKIEQVRQAVDDRKGFGQGRFGEGPFGGGEPPLTRIASAIQAVSVWLSNDAVEWLNRREALYPHRQIVEYYVAVKQIPEFYNDEEWRQAEQVIFDGLHSQVSSDLSRRHMFTAEAFARQSSTLVAERARYLAARARSKH